MRNGPTAACDKRNRKNHATVEAPFKSLLAKGNLAF
ncbi:hypothetical protein ACVJGD_006804 [Bradyrhizobium sp. USDA 10063]